MFSFGCYLRAHGPTGKMLKSPPRLRSVPAGLCTSLSLSGCCFCLARLMLVSSHGLIAGVRKSSEAKLSCSQ